MLTSPVKSYKTCAHSPAGSSFLRGGGRGAGGVGVEVVDVGEESEVTRLIGGGANCFFWVPGGGGGINDDGMAKGLSEFLEEFLTEVKNPLAEDMSTSLPNV
jgi:hypothetical protein